MKIDVDNETVKNFLLETVLIQKNRTIKKQLLYFRNGCILCFIVCSWMLYWATFNSESANAGTKIIFALAILLTIPVTLFAFRKHQNQVRTWKIEDDSIKTPSSDKYISLAGIGGGLGTAIIILLYNNIDFSEMLTMLFVITGMILGMLVGSACMCIFQHKLYLLKKHCPEIKDLKATDLQ